MSSSERRVQDLSFDTLLDSFESRSDTITGIEQLPGGEGVAIRASKRRARREGRGRSKGLRCSEGTFVF